jgi:hypothetical protein
MCTVLANLPRGVDQVAILGVLELVAPEDAALVRRVAVAHRVRVEGDGLVGFGTAARFFDQGIAAVLRGVSLEGAPGAVEFVFAACALGKWRSSFARSCLRIPCVLRRVSGLLCSEKEVFEGEKANQVMVPLSLCDWYCSTNLRPAGTSKSCCIGVALTICNTVGRLMPRRRVWMLNNMVVKKYKRCRDLSRTRCGKDAAKQLVQVAASYTSRMIDYIDFVTRYQQRANKPGPPTCDE